MIQVSKILEKLENNTPTVALPFLMLVLKFFQPYHKVFNLDWKHFCNDFRSWLMHHEGAKGKPSPLHGLPKLAKML